MKNYKYNCSYPGCGLECEAPINVKNMTLCREHRRIKHLEDMRQGAKRQNERERQYRLENPTDFERIECDSNCEHFDECQILVWQGLPLPCVPIALNDNRSDFAPAEQSSFRSGNIYGYNYGYSYNK